MKKIKSREANTKSVNLETRMVDHWISKPTVDSKNTVLIPTGCRTDRFMRNPLMFVNHDYDTKNSIGQVKEVNIGEEGVWGRTLFHERNPSHEGEWMPDTYLWLLHIGGLRSFSAGFVEDDVTRPTAEQIKLYGTKCKAVINTYDLHEVSLVGIPSNPNIQTLSIRNYSDELIRYIELGKPIKLDVLKQELKPKNKVVLLPPEIKNKMVQEKIGQKTKELIEKRMIELYEKNSHHVKY